MAPTQTPLAQIRDLESQFAAAMTQLYAVGNGLAQVRQDLTETQVRQDLTETQVSQDLVETPVAPTAPSPADLAPVSSPVQPQVGGPEVSAAPPVTPVPAVPPVPAAPPAGPRWFERPGAVAKVLGAVGAVVTLVGVAFLLAIAIAAGIFGPGPRTVAGALLAVALLAGGVVVRRRSLARGESPTVGTRITGGEALAATGLATAYLDLLAASALYGFVPGSLALVLAGALSVGAFVLARRWDSQLLAVLAAAPPMLLAPAVADIDSLATLSFVALLLVGSAFAHLGREWPWLYGARVVPGVLILLVGATVLQRTPFPVITITAAAALGMVLAGVAEQSRRLEHHPLYAALASALPLIVAVGTLDDGRLATAAAVGGLFLALAALVKSLTGGVVTSRSLWVAPLLTSTVLVILAAGALPTESQSGTVLAVVSGAYLFWAAWRRSRPVAAMGVLTGVVSGLLFVPAAVGTAFAPHPDQVLDPLSILHGLALTAVAGLAHTAGRTLAAEEAQSRITRAAFVSAFVTVSATVVLTGTWLGWRLDSPVLGFYGGHAVATALWTAVAAVLITVLAPRSRDRGLLVRVGLGLVAVAVGKLFLFDLSALSGLFRVVAFVVTGIIVLVLGVAVAREQTRDEEAEPAV